MVVEVEMEMEMGSGRGVYIPPRRRQACGGGDVRAVGTAPGGAAEDG